MLSRDLLLVASASLLMACAREAQPVRSSGAGGARPAVPTRQGTFDLADYGAAGDGVADDGPALQRALQAMAAAGGGVLVVPAGRYAIATPVDEDFTGLASAITIQGVASSTPVPARDASGEALSHGLDLVSEIFPRTGSSPAVTLRGLQGLWVRDIAFVGTPGVETDALVTLAVERVEAANVRHCEFYGLSTRLGGAILRAEQSGLTIEASAFLGSSANSGANAPVVENVEWRSINVADTIFVDYGQRPELYGKLDLGSPYSWINIGGAAAPTSESPRREVVLRNLFLDEGAYIGVTSVAGRQEPPGAEIDLVYVTGLRVNVSNLRTSGHYLDGLRGVLVEDSRYGWTHDAEAAISLHRVGEAIFSRLSCLVDIPCIRASEATGRVTIVDSKGARLDSRAQATEVIPGAGVEVDPVLYVRRQFAARIGRDPDAAAHYFWSKRILRCGKDAACVAARHSELGAYLASSPRPRFTISGQVKDEDGAALSGLPVRLSGSQPVATVTDGEGRYRFADLPTSGVYTVTVSMQDSTFPPRTFTTPPGDRVADIAATASRPWWWFGSGEATLAAARRHPPAAPPAGGRR